ncbi:MAG TPA: hypothetical protein VG034_03925 [Acidimicrobiia bacterium]|jgi:hypothetical protein|nr:hypothetical protein [Acidimicrobiia bacterium]
MLTITTPSTLDRLLEAVLSGAGVPSDLFAADAELDATVPGWRFRRRGAAAVAGQYTEWFADAAAFEELERRELPGGAVVTYLLTWEEAGVPHAAHHCHVLCFDEAGRIASDQFFCGGRWNAALLAEMAADQ